MQVGEPSLLWQLNLTPMSETDRMIAMSIIDAIDADGMLSVSLEDLAEGFGPESGIEIDEIVAVLHRIQHFDPVGVGARDLRECLLIQLRQLDPEEPAVRHARVIIDKHIQLLGAKDYLYSWAGGLGFRFDLGATNMHVDWSYTANEVFDATQWWTLKFAF